LRPAAAASRGVAGRPPPPPLSSRQTLRLGALMAGVPGARRRPRPVKGEVSVSHRRAAMRGIIFRWEEDGRSRTCASPAGISISPVQGSRWKFRWKRIPMDRHGLVMFAAGAQRSPTGTGGGASMALNRKVTSNRWRRVKKLFGPNMLPRAGSDWRPECRKESGSRNCRSATPARWPREESGASSVAKQQKGPCRRWRVAHGRRSRPSRRFTFRCRALRRAVSNGAHRRTRWTR